jgi:hypothetical protein
MDRSWFTSTFQECTEYGYDVRVVVVAQKTQATIHGTCAIISQRKTTGTAKMMIRLQNVVLGMRLGLLAMGGSRSQALRLPSPSSSANKIRINHSTLTRATPAGSLDDDDGDIYDNGEELLPEEWPNKLENPEFKNYPVAYLKEQEEKGKLVLEPFYQRGYRWTQQQASLWMESILIGFPSIPEVMLLQTEDEDGSIRFSTFDGRQRLASIILL